MGRGQGQSLVTANVGVSKGFLGIKVISGEELGAVLHTTRWDWCKAPSPEHYDTIEDAFSIDCIPQGGFWSEPYRQVSVWKKHRQGNPYKLTPKPETKILVVTSVTEVEELFRRFPAQAEKDYADEHFAISFQKLQDEGFDGIWVSQDVARSTSRLDMWDNETVFWFSKDWPFEESIISLSRHSFKEHE